MLLALAAAAPLAVAAPQDCVQSLPLPTGSVNFLGNLMTASDDYVFSTDSSSVGPLRLHIWSQVAPGDFALETSLEPGENSLAIAADGDVVGAVVGPSNDSQLKIWRRDPAGSWLPDPEVVPAVGNQNFGGSLSLEGDRLVVKSQGPRLWVYERDLGTGIWDHVQTIENPPTSGLIFGNSVDLSGDRIAARAGSFSSQAVEIYERDASGQYAHAATLPEGARINDLDLDGDRIAVARENQAEVWRRRSNGTWSLEQELETPGLKRLIDIALEGEWIAVAGQGQSATFDITRPVLTFERGLAGRSWLQRSALVPSGGVGGATSFFGADIALTSGHLVVSEPNFDPSGAGGASSEGRVTAFRVDCIQPLPAVQWVDSSIRTANSVNFPASYAPVSIATGLPFAPGDPLGLRDPQIVLNAEYQLLITGLPCGFDYNANVCTYFAHSLRDLNSGVVTDPYPVDPESGFPQVFGVGPGPSFPASTQSTQITWPFELSAGGSSFFVLEPTGQPLDLELAGTTYNCVDVGGIWYMTDPDVEAFGCGFDLLPSSVQAFDFVFGFDAELAYALPAIDSGSQVTICDGLPNSVTTGATLEAQGSATVSDNQLFVAGNGLPPQQAGLLFLSPEAATPPFLTLGSGQLCIELPLIRLSSSLGIVDGAGNYTAQLDLANLPQGTVILPGSTWYLQLVYRDANPQGTTNTSSAIGVTFD